MSVPITRNTDTFYGLLGGLSKVFGGRAGLQAGVNETARQLWSSMGITMPASAAQAGARRPPMPGLPPGYKATELAAGAAAEAFRPGAGFPGQQGSSSPAAERAYRQEVSNIAQQAAQNPELQRYEKERAAAAASKDQGKMDAARDIGMQIWAQKYGKTLAPKVKAGQSGYDAIQRTLGAGQMGSPMNFGFDLTRAGADNAGLLSPTPSVAAPSYAGATPAGLPGATPLPSNAFSGMVTTPFSGFNAGQTLTSAPLGIPGIPPTGSYEGITGVQPMGSSLAAAPSMFNPADEKAKALLEAFKNKQFGMQK